MTFITETNTTDGNVITVNRTLNVITFNGRSIIAPFLTVTILSDVGGGTVTQERLSFDDTTFLDIHVTSCGFLLKYVFGVNVGIAGSAIEVRLEADDGANQVFDGRDSFESWNLIDFSLAAGCSGFTQSSTPNSRCDACISGFFPVTSRFANVIE